jgi:SOS-response transcriptional repressor LexA
VKRTSSFVAITTEGGLLPADFLSELLSPKADIDGLTPTSYNLADGERISEQVNRSWNRLKGRWADFKKAISEKPADEFTTTETRNRWLQPLFQELGYGQRLTRAKPIEIDGKSYPVSHAWNHIPIHLVGSHIALDHRTSGAVGAAKASPHSLVQQVLNASDEHLWGIVSNGLTFRLIRDNIALTRLSYVDWDLAAIFDGDLYSEFYLLWLIAHQSRFEAERPEQCWLEKWKKRAQDKGLRALEKLRPGVARAIEALGAGLLSHPANRVLREKLSTCELTTQDFYRQVLRVIYRIIFLFVAEERDLLFQPLPPSDGPKEAIEDAIRARRRYIKFYSLTRLRKLSLQCAGTPHPDLWQILQFITNKLGSDTGCQELALPPLGGFLWGAALSTPDLSNAVVSNRSFLTSIQALASVQVGSIRRWVDYKNLGAEELGSVYEGLLELHPHVNVDTGSFELNVAAGNERKTSGSYYTPDSLVQWLLNSALEPVMDQAARGKHGQAAADALLNLKICDPAVGSGHFLIAAAHRLASRVAAARSGEKEPSPESTRTAIRDVIGRCLYGVDINPMAAELCRVNLWLESLEPGKPLSFLDHHIRVGNSLIGATPELISAGLPDSAFEVIEGDDSAACSNLKRLNRVQRDSLRHLFIAEDTAIRDRLRNAAAAIDEMRDSKPQDIHRKETAFRNFQSDYDFAKAWDLANLWCAAFVIKKVFPGNVHSPVISDQPVVNPAEIQTSFLGDTQTAKSKISNSRRPVKQHPSSISPYGITTQHLRDFVEREELPPGLLAEARRLATEYQFFHWHLSFPDVFRLAPGGQSADDARLGWDGGFDLVLGNPPWDKLTPDSKEFFSFFDDKVREANKATERLIVERLLENQNVAKMWSEHRRYRFATIHFIKESGRYILFAPGDLGKGDINSFRMFTEIALSSTNQRGFSAQIVPEGLYNGANCMALRQELLDNSNLLLLYGFENTRKGWFEGVHSSAKFCLFAAAKTGRTTNIAAAFNVESTEPLGVVKTSRQLRIPVKLIREFSPEDLSFLEFRNQQDIDIALRMYDSHPKLGDESAGEPIHSQSLEIHMTNDAAILTENSCGLPLYEGRMVDQYDHRAKGYVSGRARAAVWNEFKFGERAKTIQPQWRVLKEQVPAKVRTRITRYRIGYGWVASPTNQRSLIAALLPNNSIAGNAVPTILYKYEYEWMYLLWLATANSFVMDFVVRMKVSLNLTFTLLKSLPFPRFNEPNDLVFALAPHVLRLTCTSVEMTPFWNAMAGFGLVPRVESNTVPGTNDPQERLILRCLVDAMVARNVFRITRNELDYILNTFTIVEERDRDSFGDFRTKDLIIKAFDALSENTNYDDIIFDLGSLFLPQAARSIQRPSIHTGNVLSAQGSRSTVINKFQVMRPLNPNQYERYTNCVPIVDLMVAAGYFGDAQVPDFEEWVEINTSRMLRKGMFVAQVVGASMEPLIPNGAYCLFQFKAPQVRNNLIGLFQLHDTEDPELGGHFTVKRLIVSTQTSPGVESYRTTTLVPENPSFSRIPVETETVRLVAEFLEVLKPFETDVT